MLNSKEKFINLILSQKAKNNLNMVVFKNCKNKEDFLSFIKTIKEGNISHALLDNIGQLKKMNHIFLNTFLKNKLVASCHLDITGEWAFLWRFAVRKKYRGKGVGSLVLTELINILKNNGCRVFQISCPKNLGKFYTSLGFNIIASEAFFLEKRFK